jgi:transposase-like protein
LLNIDSSNKIKKFIAKGKPMINCPRCQHSESRKDGIVREKQRYLCKSCGYRYTVAHKGYREDVKQQALAMYLEGLGFRSIGRLLSCSHTAAYYWIRQYGEKSSLKVAGCKIEVIEMDEGHPYVGSKKKACWLWIAVDRTEKQFINVIVGSRDTDTGQCLWEGRASPRYSSCYDGLLEAL